MAPTLTYGQAILKEADRFDGFTEATGRNDGAWLTSLQREAARALGFAETTYLGAPYCAIGVGHCVRTAGMPHNPQLVHPATAFMCAQGRREGVLHDQPKVAPPGSFMIRCGIHTGIVVKDHGPSFFAFEFNHDNRCGYTWRAKADWDFIIPEPLRDEPTDPPVVMVDRFGFDDLNLKPALIGGWPTEAARDGVMEGWKDANPGWWARKVKVDRPSPYAFQVGPPGTYGAVWEYGGWGSEEAREDRLDAYANRVGHRNLRRWRRTVPLHVDSAGNPIAADSGTNL